MGLRSLQELKWTITFLRDPRPEFWLHLVDVPVASGNRGNRRTATTATAACPPTHVIETIKYLAVNEELDRIAVSVASKVPTQTVLHYHKSTQKPLYTHISFSQTPKLFWAPLTSVVF